MLAFASFDGHALNDKCMRDEKEKRKWKISGGINNGLFSHFTQFLSTDKCKFFFFFAKMFVCKHDWYFNS